MEPSVKQKNTYPTSGNEASATGVPRPPMTPIKWDALISQVSKDLSTLPTSKALLDKLGSAPTIHLYDGGKMKTPEREMKNQMLAGWVEADGAFWISVDAFNDYEKNYQKKGFSKGEVAESLRHLAGGILTHELKHAVNLKFLKINLGISEMHPFIEDEASALRAEHRLLEDKVKAGVPLKLLDGPRDDSMDISSFRKASLAGGPGYVHLIKSRDGYENNPQFIANPNVASVWTQSHCQNQIIALNDLRSRLYPSGNSPAEKKTAEATRKEFAAEKLDIPSKEFLAGRVKYYKDWIAASEKKNFYTVMKTLYSDFFEKM